jgi:hypothetical protein
MRPETVHRDTEWLPVGYADPTTLGKQPVDPGRSTTPASHALHEESAHSRVAI